MVPVKKAFIHLFHLKWFDKLETIDDSKLVAVSNTGYELEMDTGLDDITD